jgi:hypothetical protein
MTVKALPTYKFVDEKKSYLFVLANNYQQGSEYRKGHRGVLKV